MSGNIDLLCIVLCPLISSTLLKVNKLGVYGSKLLYCVYKINTDKIYVYVPSHIIIIYVFTDIFIW